jgi:hypothetical protein
MNCFSTPNPTTLQLLIDEIKFQQQKELQFAALQGILFKYSSIEHCVY